jgi:hypothetical protein
MQKMEIAIIVNVHEGNAISLPCGVPLESQIILVVASTPGCLARWSGTLINLYLIDSTIDRNSDKKSLPRCTPSRAGLGAFAARLSRNPLRRADRFREMTNPRRW